VNGFAVFEQYHSQVLAPGVSDAAPSANPAVGLDPFCFGVPCDFLDPLVANGAAIRTLAHVQKAPREPHSESIPDWPGKVETPLDESFRSALWKGPPAKLTDGPWYAPAWKPRRYFFFAAFASSAACAAASRAIGTRYGEQLT
jgi:hypothetical protein